MSLRTIVSWCAVLVIAYYIWTGLGNAGARGWNSPRGYGASTSAAHASSSWFSFAVPVAEFFSPGSSRPSWSQFNLGRATLDSPCVLDPVPDTRSPQQKQYVWLDQFKGTTTDACEITYAHALYPQLRGEFMLDTFSHILDALAPGSDYSRYPSQTGAVILNGLRARRFDFDRLKDSTIYRARYVFFSKGNQVWSIGVECAHDAPEVEQTFLKMANSLRPD
jgi:hypothetical protein